ncbi:MAG TPA: GspH/FimT family pseudopilin [Gammaproteobacteria bacterium]|nr:GspH/FimT family pseudopilin [Gammaproteobacteria bacterium]
MASSRGFTLLELLVALTIGALLLTIGVPSFQNTIADRRLSASVNDLLTSFRVARSEAIKSAHYVTVCKSANGTTCGNGAVNWESGWIVFVNADVATPGTVDAGDNIIRVHSALPTGLTLRPGVGVVDGFVSFRPTGSAGTSAANLSGTLAVCGPSGRAAPRALIVTASGGASVSYHAADGSALVCP